MIKNIKFGKKFIAGLLAVTLIGTGIGGYHLYKKNEINRVKGYLEDFLTEENYVDLSKISKDYKICDFNGWALASALEELDVSYVRITDSYIYDGNHVEGFTEKTATNYNNIIGIDDNNQYVYEGYEPIRNTSDEGVTYSYPEGYVLEDIIVYQEPIRYDELSNRVINVIENEYEDSYSLIMKKKR